MKTLSKHSVLLTVLMLSAPVSVLAMEEKTLEKPLTAQELWKEFQALGSLNEQQQKDIAKQAHESQSTEVADLIECAKTIQEHSEKLLEGLKKGKEQRQGTLAKTGRALNILRAVVTVDKQLISEDSDDQTNLLDRIYALSSVTDKQLEAMIALVPQAKTADIEQLIEKFEQINNDLDTFKTKLEEVQSDKECVIL